MWNSKVADNAASNSIKYEVLKKENMSLLLCTPL